MFLGHLLGTASGELFSAPELLKYFFMVGRTTLNLFISAPIFSSDNIQSSQNTVLAQGKHVKKKNLGAV